MLSYCFQELYVQKFSIHIMSLLSELYVQPCWFIYPDSCVQQLFFMCVIFHFPLARFLLLQANELIDWLTDRLTDAVDQSYSCKTGNCWPCSSAPPLDIILIGSLLCSLNPVMNHESSYHLPTPFLWVIFQILPSTLGLPRCFLLQVLLLESCMQFLFFLMLLAHSITPSNVW